MEGKIKKLDLTKFAKDCVYAHEKNERMIYLEDWKR